MRGRGEVSWYVCKPEDIPNQSILSHHFDFIVYAHNICIPMNSNSYSAHAVGFCSALTNDDTQMTEVKP